VCEVHNCFAAFLSTFFTEYFQAGIKDQQSHEEAKAILLKMGEFFQIQVRIGDKLLVIV